MANVKLEWADANLKKFGKDIAELNRRFPKALPREINKVGARARTQVVRNLTTQTGLPRKTIVKAVKVSLAGGRKLSYEMVTRGGEVRLKYLAPRETSKGVSAAPRGKRTVFPGTFMKGGRFPNRKIVPAFKGHVFRRIGWGERTDGTVGEKLTHARSGMTIPAEMTTGATRDAFERIAGPLLQQRVDALIGNLLK